MPDDLPIEPPGAKQVEPGLHTTEFWLAIGSSILAILGQIGGVLPEPWGAVVTAVVGAAYSISRGIAKK